MPLDHTSSRSFMMIFGILYPALSAAIGTHESGQLQQKESSCSKRSQVSPFQKQYSSQNLYWHLQACIYAVWVHVTCHCKNLKLGFLLQLDCQTFMERYFRRGRCCPCPVSGANVSG